MHFKEKLLAHLLCNLVQTLQGALGLWTDLAPEEINIRKALRRVDINPIVQFGLGPFESPNDQIYQSSQFVKEVEANNRRIQGKISELKTPQTKQPESQQIQSSSRSSQKGIEGDKEKKKQREEKVTPSDRKQVEGTMTKSEFNHNSSSEASKILHEELKNIKNRLKALRQKAESLHTLEKELGSVEDESSIGSVGKFSRIYEMRENLKKMEENENKNRVTDKNGFKGMNNNIAFNNQYQIDRIFIINRLSEGKEPSDSKSNDCKEPDVQIFDEFTAAKMKKLLLEMLNYLNGQNIFKETETDCSRDTNPSPPPSSPPPRPRLDEMEMKFLREFERNFSRIFPHGNVTREEVNRMIKVMDFVDRYRGTVNTLNPWSGDIVKESESSLKMVEDGLKDMTKNKEVDDLEDTTARIRGNGKVLCDDSVSDLFTRLDVTESSNAKKKGSLS